LILAALIVFLLPGKESKPDVASNAGGKSAASASVATAESVTQGTAAATPTATATATATQNAIHLEAVRGHPEPNVSRLNADPALSAGAAVQAGAAANSPTGSASSSAHIGSVASGVVQFSAKGLTWVEVTDTQGGVQLRRTLQAGETASAGGMLPLRVVVGRVDSTTVTVRGQTFDMAPLARDNVARFEIK
jgi:cytoskeleton protein RodZ